MLISPFMSNFPESYRLCRLIFDVMSLQLIMKRKKGPNTQPGLARQHLLDKYSDLPAPHLIQNGHILFLYVTAESSRAATAREIIRYIPEMTEEQAKNKVKLLVEKTLTVSLKRYVAEDFVESPLPPQFPAQSLLLLNNKFQNLVL